MSDLGQILISITNKLTKLISRTNKLEKNIYKITKSIVQLTIAAVDSPVVQLGNSQSISKNIEVID